MHAEHPLAHIQRILPSKDCRIVLDLGSGSGTSALQLKHAYPGSQVFAFECDPFLIPSTRSSLGVDGIEFSPLAVHEHAGCMPFYPRGTNSGASSGLRPLEVLGGPDVPLQVQAIRLDVWLNTRGLPSPDLVWCDIEGDTLSALRSLGSLLFHVGCIYFPVKYRPQYCGEPDFRTLDELMRQSGLRCLQHRQVLPGHWGYAIYARADLAAFPVMHGKTEDSESLSWPFVRGGIGDLLQHIPAAISARQLRVFSHFHRASDVFAPFGLRVAHTYFEENSAHLSYDNDGSELEREYFPRIPMPKPSLTIETVRYRRVVGLHPFGSRYSNTFAHRFGAPAKWMPSDFVDALLAQLLGPDDLLVAFCAPSERHRLEPLLSTVTGATQIVSSDYLWDSLSVVPACNVLVGVDSALKTMSSILRIPTVTLVGDFNEPFRDRHFLNPYIAAGVMLTVKYRELGPREAGLTARAALDLLGM